MKTYRSTLLFLSCSGGERSVNCVRPALEIEASKEEQRSVVHFSVAESAGAIKSKRPGMLSDGIIILPDNARPHTENLVRDKLQRFGWETLQHPLHSPDLSPCNFHIFVDLKEDIRGRGFHSEEEV